VVGIRTLEISFEDSRNGGIEEIMCGFKEEEKLVRIFLKDC